MSPKLTPSQRRPQFQGWLRTKSFQVHFVLKILFHNRSLHSEITCLLKDEMERYQAHKEFGDRRIGVYGARTFFYQANILNATSIWQFVCKLKMRFFLTALPISTDKKENGVQPNKVKCLIQTSVRTGRGQLWEEPGDVPAMHWDGGQYHPGKEPSL